jgi:hypothetical protein
VLCKAGLKVEVMAMSYSSRISCGERVLVLLGGAVVVVAHARVAVGLRRPRFVSFDDDDVEVERFDQLGSMMAGSCAGGLSAMYRWCDRGTLTVG